MKMKSLASVFSRALNNVPGQAVAVFPEGLGKEFLLDVANFMNQIDSSQHVRALVMHDSELGATEQTPVVNERGLVSYRLVDEGNRLVVANRPFLFDSKNNVFKPVLFEGFPDGSDGPDRARPDDGGDVHPCGIDRRDHHRHVRKRQPV